MIRNNPVRTSNHPADNKGNAAAGVARVVVRDAAAVNAAAVRVDAKQAAHAAAQEAPEAVPNRVRSVAQQNAAAQSGDVPRRNAEGLPAGRNPQALRNRVRRAAKPRPAVLALERRAAAKPLAAVAAPLRRARA